jgi:hypothetical protein
MDTYTGVDAAAAGLAGAVRRAEEEVLCELEVIEKLTQWCRNKRGLRAFAEAFFFVRCEFVRINFVVGSRCSRLEEEWGGLARNLYEELGGGYTKTHNQLYREFLSSAGGAAEGDLVEPEFARRFNAAWLQFAGGAPLRTALLGVAAYEVLDGPDYSALYSMLTSSNPSADLTFFRVHAEANHFELFHDLLRQGTVSNQDVRNDFEIAGRFVLRWQRFMWAGLLQHIDGEMSNGQLGD